MLNISNPTNLLIAGLYLVLVGILSFFSIFGVYILMRYGKSTPIAFAVSLFYAFVFLQILNSSYQTLQKLLV
jgi:hypothetical protein